MAVITADDIDFEFDVGQGGVALAQSTAIQVSGYVRHAPGTATTHLDDLRRFDQLQTVKGPSVDEVLEQYQIQVLATGKGRELYKDPGENTVKEVIHSPRDAVRDALLGAASAIDCEVLHINFIGGDDLQLLEVLDAAEQLVLMLDVKTKCQVFFSSVSDSRFPNGVASVLVLGTRAWNDRETDAFVDVKGVERALAMCQVYFYEGVYYAAVEEDLNPSVS